MTGSRPKDASGGPKVAVIGAGVCGLGIGWRLAEAGCRVTVFDRGSAGQGASWAAAGMLAAGVECEPGEEPLLQLTLESQRLWPTFRRELEAASGRAIGYRDEGTLVAALNRDDVEELRFNYEFQRGLGVELEWLNGGQARTREPYLRSSAPAAVYSARDHQVDNRLLVLALKEAFLRAGGELQENATVTAIETAAGHAAGVVVDDRRFAAEAVVMAAGAWSRQIEGLPEALRPPVRPVKGQMLALSMDPAEPLLRHVLWAPRIYMVPRDDGRLIVGGTVEERGFDDSLTAGGVFSVLEAAWRAVPAIEELPIAEMWVGFRPTSRDDAPILGPGPIEGLYLATGHHRNGILLAPATADYVSQAILEGGVPEAIRDFTLARFQPGEAQPRQAVGGER
ncbi:MAG: glycine oxidase ThiO [Kiloniellales bacterium]|nr:glycine oxidase ThiO [Kiloniellales bacterium]MDJ0969479.1 glycine oxidase ThiO [Kiloniellales bacterium]